MDGRDANDPPAWLSLALSDAGCSSQVSELVGAPGSPSPRTVTDIITDFLKDALIWSAFGAGAGYAVGDLILGRKLARQSYQSGETYRYGLVKGSGWTTQVAPIVRSYHRSCGAVFAFVAYVVMRSFQ